MATDRIVPVILSGGSGTRLWPLSRTMYPSSSSAFSTVRAACSPPRCGASTTRTFPRLSSSATTTIASSCARSCSGAAMTPDAIILEPVARNTAAAVAVAALAALKKSPDAIIAVMPSDHVVKDGPAFTASLSVRQPLRRPASSFCSASCRRDRIPAMATFAAVRSAGKAARGRCLLRKAHAATAEKYVADATISGTAAFSFRTRAPSCRVRATGAAGARCGARRLRRGHRGSRLSPPRRRAFARPPRSPSITR